MIKKKIILMILPALFMLSTIAFAAGGDQNGPYSHWYGDTRPGIPDPGIPGWIGPSGDGLVGHNLGPDNYINPIFKGWATGYLDYIMANEGVQWPWRTPEEALGPVTGNNMDIVSLGDMNRGAIDAWMADPDNNPGPGRITLTFDAPIYNGPGPDFAVFENGFESYSGFGNMLFGELGYVEVSSDGLNFARFASEYSASTEPVGGYGTIDSTYIYNLLGKHANNGYTWGTPFDLETLTDDELIRSGLVDLNDINYVKIIDIPGSGDFLDANGNPIYDAWVTWGSGGLDLEAVGVINTVPVPGAIWLLGSGLAGLLCIFRRKSAADNNAGNPYAGTENRV